MRPTSAYVLYRLGRYTHSPEAIPILKKALQYAQKAPLKPSGFCLYNTVHCMNWIQKILLARLMILMQKHWKQLKSNLSAKFDPERAEYYIMTMQRDNKIGMFVRRTKETSSDQSN